MASSFLNRGIILGAPVGLVVGALVYGGIGYWIAGTTGLTIGLIICSIFATIGAIQLFRFSRSIAALERQYAQLDQLLHS